MNNTEQEKKDEHVEELIDEAGEESFPASDPPAVTPVRKKDREETPPRKREETVPRSP